jgi:hypothetical protein
MKTPARRPAFHKTRLSPDLAAVVVAILVLTIVLAIIVAALQVMPAMLAADVVAVDPMMPGGRHVAGDPNHFGVACPVARAMAVEWPVTDFDLDALRANRGRQ